MVVELAGGNDGFNTLVPYLHEPYYRMRPNLALPRQKLLPISDGMGLNPALQGLHRLWEQGYLGVLQGVGSSASYRRSKGDTAHQFSRDALHAVWGSSGGRQASGWLARSQELLANERSEPAWAVSLNAPDDGPLLGARSLLSARPLNLAGYGDVLGFPSAVDEARVAVFEKLLSIGGRAFDTQLFSDDSFSRSLRDVAGLIGLSERGEGGSIPLHRVALGSFDTHRDQAVVHTRLLSTLGDGLWAFNRALEQMGVASRVLVLVLSEFGRSLGENATAGTDHGGAGVGFLVGRGIYANLHGHYVFEEQQSPSIEFSSLYRGVLEEHFVLDSARVLGRGPLRHGIYEYGPSVPKNLA